MVTRALDQSGASDVGKYAKERWCEYKKPTFTSSVSPAPVRHENLIRGDTTRKCECRQTAAQKHVLSPGVGGPDHKYH